MHHVVAAGNQQSAQLHKRGVFPFTAAFGVGGVGGVSGVRAPVHPGQFECLVVAVGAFGGEEIHVVAEVAQRCDHGVAERFEPAGVGFAHRVARGPDQRDAQLAGARGLQSGFRGNGHSLTTFL